MKKTNMFIMVGMFIFLVGVSYNIGNTNNDSPDTNYYGLSKLGLAPSTEARQPTENDLDTGLRYSYEDDVYALVSSRELKYGDYGKTFVVKIN